MSCLLPESDGLSQARCRSLVRWSGCLALLLASACENPPSQKKRIQPDDLTAKPVTGEVLTDSDSLAIPVSIDVVGEHLVVADEAGARMIRVFRSRDGALVASFGRQGDGPGEFRGPTHADPVPGSSTAFWVHDRALRRTSYFDLASDTLAPRSAGHRSVSYDPGQLPFYVRWIGGESLVGSGIVTPGRLGFFDGTGKLARTTGEIPGNNGKTPETVLQHAYSGTLVANPTRTRLALANRHADRLEIYDASGRALQTVHVRDGFLPVFETRSTREGSSLASGEDMRFGYIDADATEHAIYGLFSGVRRMDRPGRAGFGDFVYIFDWEGRVTSVLKLDALAIDIAVDPEDRTLYALLFDPQPAIVRYQLPQSPARTAAR